MSADPYARLKAELKALPKVEIKKFWADLGYVLLPSAPEWLDRPEAGFQTERLLRDAEAALRTDLAAAGLLEGAGGDALTTLVREFYDLAPQSPVQAKKGGNGFNGSLQIFAIARLIQPRVIIESGVFRGQTTWVLRKACPEATILCFDVDFSNLVYKDRDALYTEADWSGFDLSALPGAEVLAFFDDHMDQGRRVLESQARGIKRLIFDDNASASRIHTIGGPPIPTLDMLLDASLDDKELVWRYRGRQYRCQIDAKEAAKVRQAIRHAHNFKDLHNVTGYTPARISYVSLN